LLGKVSVPQCFGFLETRGFWLFHASSQDASHYLAQNKSLKEIIDK